jgi:hypothetical protein
LDLASRERFLLFFHDDDDLFATNLPSILANLEDDDDVSVHVFPLLRIHSDVVTFVREGHPAAAILGAQRDFDFRFQSNNYALSSSILMADVLTHMKDHVEASSYADSYKLSEKVHPHVCGATIKTPCSASYLPRLLDNPKGFENNMRSFVRNLRNLRISGDYDWLNSASKLIAELFQATLSGKRFQDLSPQISALNGTP